jgi:HK97 family phage major capsid protein
MNSFSRKYWPLLAVVAMVAAGSALAAGGVIDYSYLAAMPLLAPMAFMGDMKSQTNVTTVRALLTKRTGLIEAASKITEAAAAASLELTAEQKKTIDDNLAAVATIDGDVKRLQALIEAERGAPIEGKVFDTRPNVLDDPKRGFKSFTDFAVSVMNAGMPNARAVDERLAVVAAAPTTFGNENVGQDGGYLVPTEFASEITKLSLDSDAFLPRTDGGPVSGNSITFPSDETTPWGTNGVRVYWAAEAQAATQTKPIIKPNTMRLNKLLGLVTLTDELLADAPAMAAYVQSQLGRSIKWKVNDALVNGDGVGKPVGILNAGALVAIAIEAAQATGTLLPANVAKMYAAMPADYLAGAEWIIAPDLLPQLMTMVLGNNAVWTPPMQGFPQAPGGFLFGKPITFSQTCAAKGSQGDIIFVNWKAYRTISKDGVQIASSMHLYFDADATAFRSTFRLDGQPVLKASIAQARGAQALSPYVTLAARP